MPQPKNWPDWASNLHSHKRGIEAGIVHIQDETIAAGTVIWTAGTTATPVADWLGVKPGPGGRVAVGADLSVPSHPRIDVIGDAVLAVDVKGSAATRPRTGRQAAG